MGFFDKIKKLFNKSEQRLLLNAGDHQLSIEETEEETENKEKNANILMNNLLKYGITQDEWNEIERYKSTDYFVSNTLLHDIDIFKLNRPAYADTFNELLEPEKAVNFYCKIYSAMYKYGKMMSEEKQIYRVCSKEFYDEMKKSGQTESLLSFSSDGYHSDFFKDKNNPILIKGLLKKGIPCIDFKKLYGFDMEEEVLLPPYLGIEYNYNGFNNMRKCDEYIVNLEKKSDSSLLEKSDMMRLRKSVINSTIPEDYYRNWYNITARAPYAKGDDKISIELRKKYIEWQKNFKKYLKYRFKEIEYEIDLNEYHKSDNDWMYMLKKGDVLGNNGISFQISSDLMKYQNYYAIYADLISQDDTYVCMTGRIKGYKAPIIIKNKKVMDEMNLNLEERRAIYCHELGHYYNQKEVGNSKKERLIDDEINSDNFAIKKLKVKPEIMENTLKKMRKYYIEKNNGTDIYMKLIHEIDCRCENVKKIQKNDMER